MNNQTLLGEIVVDKKLSPIELRKTMQGMYINGELPLTDPKEYSVHFCQSQGEEILYYYYIYSRFYNIIEITL